MQPAAEILGLTTLLDRYPRQLSGGQRQRVAMGRAIVRDPQVFLFDEPLSNLDAKLRVSMRAEIKNLHQRLKTTTVYVTHDQIEAMTMADKIVVMHDGRVEQIGAPLDLYDTPGQPLRRGLHRLAGDEHADRPDRPADGGRFVTGDGHRAAGRAAARRRRRAAVVYGLRPESMHLGGDVPLRVDVVEPTGSETHVLGAARRPPRSSASSASASRPRPGEEIRVSVDAAGRRISSTPPPGARISA